jgi:hypothetical protein
MRWFKKQKYQEPWTSDFDVVRIALLDGAKSTNLLKWTVPDNLYLHLLGIEYKVQTWSALNTYHMVYVDHEIRRTYSCGSLNVQAGSETYYWSWMAGHISVRPNTNSPFPTQSLGEHVYIYPGDILSVLFQPNSGSPKVEDWIITARQWKVY